MKTREARTPRAKALGEAICRLVEADRVLSRGDTSFDEVIEAGKTWSKAADTIDGLVE